MFIDCKAIPADHAQALVITPVKHMQHVLFRLGHRSQVFQLVGPDALLTESFTPEPETACNSLCHRREVIKRLIDDLL